jgi:hypothetical protein
MNGTLAYTPRPVSYTYPEEEAAWWADNPPRSQKNDKMCYHSKIFFEILQNKFQNEFSQYRDFLDGKIISDSGKPMDAGFYYDHWGKCELWYIKYPDEYEKYVEEIYKQLSETNQAWVNNTRLVIKKYHDIYIEAQKKLQEKKNDVQFRPKAV